MDAMEIYKKLSQPPTTALKTITAGNIKGFTDINPQWRYEAMTEIFGLVGIGWKYEVQRLWTEQGANNETLAFAQVAVYVRNPETKEWSDAIVGIGGSKLTNAFSKGLQSNDEGYKMAVTDAFSTSLKMIGVAADIYAGRWDGTKYKELEAPVDPSKLQELTIELEGWIQNRALNGKSLEKAQFYINSKDIEGIKRTLDYLKSQNQA